MKNLRQLHIIRGLAALYVAIGHAKVVFWSGGQDYLQQYPRSEWGVLDYGLFALDMASSAAQEFVIVFFLLSGFFIAFSFDRNNWTIKSFLVNRMLRIYPPYLFSAILAVLVFGFIGYYNEYLFSPDIDKAINFRMRNSYNELNWETTLRSLFFLPNKDYIAGNFSYWSLLPEWLFYIMVPFVITKRKIMVSIFAIFFVVDLTFFHIGHSHLWLFVSRYGFYFFLGAIFFDFVKSDKWRPYLKSSILSYLAVFILLMSTIGLGILEYKPWSHLSACALTMVAILTMLKYPVEQKIVYRLGVFLGDISYSLYVLHLPIYYFLLAILTKETGIYMYYSRIYWLMIPIAVLLSYVGYLLVEKQSITWIKRLKRN